MSFLFASSHLPATARLKGIMRGAARPPEEDEDEEDQAAQPEPRAGSVRAFSHLPEPVRAQADFDGPLSTRPAIPVGRPRPSAAPEEDPDHTPDSAHEDTDHAPEPDSDLHDAPEDDTGHHEPEDSSPWYQPRITAKDLPPQDHHEDEDEPGHDSSFDETNPAGRSSTHPEDTHSDFHDPDALSEEDPTQQDHPARPQGRLFEKHDSPNEFVMQQQGRERSGSFSQQSLKGSPRAMAAQQQVRAAAPPAQGVKPAAQPKPPAAAQPPATGQKAPAAPQPPAGGGGGNQAGEHPYKINEADENAEIVRTTNASAPPPRKGAKFGEHTRSVINDALDNSPTARAALDKARELSGKNVVIHSTRDIHALPQIGLDGTIHIYVNPNTLLPGTLTHEIAHAIQHWHLHAAEKAKRATGGLTPAEVEAAKKQGRSELHGIAPVSYVDPKSKPEDETSDNEPSGKSVEHEAMRLANITNAEISAAKVKAKVEAFKKSNPDQFNEMSKDPEKMAEFVAQSFWFEQGNLEALSHQANKDVPMPESTLYGKDGGLQHVLETLGYGVTMKHIKNTAPLRGRYAPSKPPK